MSRIDIFAKIAVASFHMDEVTVVEGADKITMETILAYTKCDVFIMSGLKEHPELWKFFLLSRTGGGAFVTSKVAKFIEAELVEFNGCKFYMLYKHDDLEEKVQKFAKFYNLPAPVFHYVSEKEVFPDKE